MNSNALLGLTALLLLSGCAGAPVAGVLYSDVSFPNDATSNQAGNRVGEACATSVLGLVATGDASIEAARRNGGITTISSVDTQLQNILFLYAKACTIVRGR